MTSHADHYNPRAAVSRAWNYWKVFAPHLVASVGIVALLRWLYGGWYRVRPGRIVSRRMGVR